MYSGGHGCLVSVMYLIFVLGVSMFLAGLAISWSNDVFAFVKPDRTAVVEISDTMTGAQVAEILKNAGVVEHQKLFEIYARFSKADQKFKSGKYELNSKLDYPAIARKLRSTSAQKRDTVWVTIPEGYTTKQIVDALVTKGVAGRDALMDTIANYSFTHDFVKPLKKGETRLEGYLFPDTYEFYINDNAPDVIAKFLDNFKKKYTNDLSVRAKELDMELKDVVIIASLVEREAKLNDEKPVIASVILNRLAKPEEFPFLQIDASLQYLTGKAPTADDKNIDSPYNTYMYKGLPPTAIANPGIDAIASVLYSAETEYYYYVARKDGSHIFTSTLEEHNNAIQEAAATFEAEPEEEKKNENQ
ncbi:MAG: endolytic transglycosylase MltG [Clostridiales bacterium]|nr:endolytic transglycosylase MltG [Clostridiales bacterium]